MGKSKYNLGEFVWVDDSFLGKVVGIHISGYQVEFSNKKGEKLHWFVREDRLGVCRGV